MSRENLVSSKKSGKANESTKALKEIKNRLDRWQKDPYAFCRAQWGLELYRPGLVLDNPIWQLQYDVLQACPRAIVEHKPIVIGSGHALGKDYIMARVALWFLQVFRPSKVIETAPTDRQVKLIMWGEVQTAWANRKMDLGGIIFKTPRLEIDPKDWFLQGFTTKETGATKEGGGGKFTGFHSTSFAALVSEAQSMEDYMYDQLDAVATGEIALLVFAGNPTRAKGRFAQMLRDKKNNIVFNFSCLENPNYLERKTVVPGLASYDWVEDRRRRWGENDPRWIGRVLGQIPENALNKVFTDDLINHACDRFGRLAKYSENAGVAVDVAGEGVDENVYMAGAGGEVVNSYARTCISPSDSAQKAVDMCKLINGKFVIFDADGMGIRDYQQASSYSDKYLEGIHIVKFHGSASSDVVSKFQRADGKEDIRKVYANKRAEAAFTAADRIRDGKATIDPNDKELIEDLQAVYWFEKNGMIYLIDKEDIREELDRSPGRGDSWIMLQWGFSQNFENKTTYDRRENQLPSYAQNDTDVFMGDRPHNLPGPAFSQND